MSRKVVVDLADDPLAATAAPAASDDKSEKTVVDDATPLAQLDVAKLAVKKKISKEVTDDKIAKQAKSIESLKLGDGDGLFSSGPATMSNPEERTMSTSVGFVGVGEDDTEFEDLMVNSLLEREKPATIPTRSTVKPVEQIDLPDLPDEQLLERLERATSHAETVRVVEDKQETPQKVVESSSISDDFDFDAYIAAAAATAGDSSEGKGGLFD